MKPFNLLTSPLAGTNLIEAGAGTGKTYTISGLFLRLILERQISAEQILVVTYTKAATEELKERIRKKLLQAKAALIQGYSDKDNFIDALVKKHGHPPTAIQLLQDALIDFDRVPIFTIHGFCRRILSENAFETGNLFDTELVTDLTRLTKEVAADFWRKHFYHSPPELIRFSAPRLAGPGYFQDLLDKIKTPVIKILPDIMKPTLEHLEPFRKAFRKLQNAWSGSREDIIRLLKDPSLDGRVYGSPKSSSNGVFTSKRDFKISVMVSTMDGFVAENSTGFPLFRDFEKFTTTKISSSVKADQTPPFHEIFDICDQLQDLGTVLESEMEAYLLFLKNEFIRFAFLELQHRKKNRNILFYDDLLVRLMRALDDPGGNELADAIRLRYKAALIDEFQDTDPVQYAIFSRLFPSHGGLLFLIGDPKQAIYSFRGADIFSYMDASRHTDATYTLTENWRSEPGLITAVNTLFSNVKAPFVFGDIVFEKGKPSSKAKDIRTPKNDETPLPTIEASCVQGVPLTLWYLIPEKISDREKLFNKTEAVQLISQAVAAEISFLISNANGKYPSGFHAADIAVLVRTNRQARIIKEHLSQAGIPAVQYSSENIFDSHEALEMERILMSISEPANQRRFRAALATDMLGATGKNFDFSDVPPEGWEKRLADFIEYFRLWESQGFIRMFQLFLAQEKIRDRLMSYPDGERRLTNVLHLSEILHHVSHEKKEGVRGLIKWFCEQRDPKTSRLEEHQIRLESDESAVKIVTIHKSKGLEYDIVFCPFGWEGSHVKGKEIVFHDPEANGTLTLDLSPNEEGYARMYAQNELLSENLRLLYVALTRAKKRCYLVWGRINTAETSAMAYLFHNKRCDNHADLYKDSGKDWVFCLKENFTRIGNDEFLTDLKQIIDRSQGTIELVSLPVERAVKVPSPSVEKETLSCLEFFKRIETAWKISSYSALVSGHLSKGWPTTHVELPDRDAFLPYIDPHTSPRLYQHMDHIEASDSSGKTDIFTFPRGARSGIFFHNIFEHLDFALLEESRLEELVTQELKEFGFETKWEETVCKMVRNVLSVPLPEVEEGFMLSALNRHERMHETEFYFPLNFVTPQTLRGIFRAHGSSWITTGFPEQLEKLAFSPVRGFMKGYVDMIFQYRNRFFLVDWKSNYLGASLSDYQKEVLTETMASAFYVLQYHLYTLALHQYLKTRIPDYRYETHFGGIFYMFIRGVNSDKGPDWGIYYGLPGQALLKALGKSLLTNFNT